MTTEPSTPVTSEDLSAYFDEELSPEQAAAIERALAEDPLLRTEHEQFGLLRGTLRAALEAEAQAVPAARFEQIWDEIDRAIERDARLQAEADRHASIWTRLWAAVRPVRVPVLAAAAAAAVVAVVMIGSGSDVPNNPAGSASVAEAQPPATNEPIVAPPADSKRLAAKEPQVAPAPLPSADPKLPPMPVPESSEAEIHGIEFGGKHGRISHTGTVTVLYVEEDETPPNSERSL
jgi:negative regulator of sigma E activity